MKTNPLVLTLIDVDAEKADVLAVQKGSKPVILRLKLGESRKLPIINNNQDERKTVLHEQDPLG